MRASTSVRITEDWDEGQDAFRVSTASARYYLQKQAGGFSSIHDVEGFDWVGFKATDYGGRPGDAAGIYRGLPNLVWPDNLGHPGHTGVQSRQTSGNVITSVTDDGDWEWTWSFFDDGAELEVIRAPADKKYWFLYEGTQGGRFDPARSFWGTERHGRRRDTPDCHTASEFHDHWKATYFGFDSVGRVFYAAMHCDEAPLNLMSYMGSTKDSLTSPDGMTVFGFGRGVGPVSLLKGPARFSIGFLETTDHATIERHFERLLA